MDNRKPVASAVFCVLACAAAVAVGKLQVPPLRPQFGSSTDPQPLPGESPEQLAEREKRLWATRAEVGRLDDATAEALDAGDYAAAEATARQSLALGIEAGRSQYYLATALFQQDKDQEALQVYQAIADRYRNGVVYDSWPYAMLLLKAGHWPEAVAVYDTALKVGNMNLLRQGTHFSPDVPQPRELEAAIRIGLGMTYPGGATWGGKRTNETVLANLHRALELEPDSPVAHFYYWRVLWRMGRKAEARAALQRAADLDQEGAVRAQAQQEMQWP